MALSVCTSVNAFICSSGSAPAPSSVSLCSIFFREAVKINRRTAPDIELFSWVAAGFLLFLVLDRIVSSKKRAILGTASLCLHSFLDGMAIGLGFHVSAAVGAIIAAGVIAHDFADGLNTIIVSLRGGTSRGAAGVWLLLDAFAPLLGIAVAIMIPIPEYAFGAALGVFGGMFLYLGASQLVPESHRAYPTFVTTAMTIVGATFIYAVVAAAG